MIPMGPQKLTAQATRTMMGSPRMASMLTYSMQISLSSMGLAMEIKSKDTV
jgi:hypothetical protein